MQVYETGPLRGLPRRAGHLQLVEPSITQEQLYGSRLRTAEIVQFHDSAPRDRHAYAGDPALIDHLDIPGIPADAAAPPIAVSAARPFRSGSAVIVILIACTLLYFAVRILGRLA